MTSRQAPALSTEIAYSTKIQDTNVVVIGLTIYAEDEGDHWLIAIPPQAATGEIAEVRSQRSAEEKVAYALTWLPAAGAQAPSGLTTEQATTAIRFTSKPSCREIAKAYLLSDSSESDIARANPISMGGTWSRSASPSRAASSPDQIKSMQEDIARLTSIMSEQATHMRRLMREREQGAAGAQAANNAMPRKREGARLKGLQKGGHLRGDQQQAGSGYNTENWETQDDWDDDEDGDGDDDMSALSDSLTRHLMQTAPGVRGRRAPRGTNPQDLIQLEMLRLLSRMNGKRRDDEGSDSESGEDDNGLNLRYGSKKDGFHKLEAMKARVLKNPKRVCKLYRSHVKDCLGVIDSRQVWLYRDFTRRLLPTFGKMRGLWRIHNALSEIHQLQMGGRADQASAFTVQLLRALHQVAIDHGEWHTALKLLPHKDPLERETFGGTEQDLQAVYAYQESLNKLKYGRDGHQGNNNNNKWWKENQNYQQQDNTPQLDAEGNPIPAPPQEQKGKGKGKGKGQKGKDNNGL